MSEPGNESRARPNALFRCVVVTRQKGDLEVYQRAEEVLQNDEVCGEVDRLLSKKVEPSVVQISAEETFASASSYTNSIQELCRADLAIFDITEYHCGVMLLLGIRSIVRRGINTCVTSSADFAFMPFNLRALRPILATGLQKDVFRRLRIAVIEGLRRRAELPESYLDLPAFYDVRLLGNTPRAYQPVLPAEEVLLLQSYDPDFYAKAGGKVEAAIDNVFGDGRSLRIVDSRSPQLAEQRLYAAIRRDKLCVIDWTGGRPNVFFEMGVRLAVNLQDPIHLIAEAECHKDVGLGMDAVQKLIKPFSYSLTNTVPLTDLLKTYKTAEERAAPYPRGAECPLHPGQTYEIVRDAFTAEDLGAYAPVHVQLRHQAMAMVGENPLDDGTMPTLYSDNPEVADRARAAAVERLMAAWDHLMAETRRSQAEPQRVEELIGESNHLYTLLRETLRGLRGTRFRELAKYLKDSRKDLRSMGADRG